MIEEEKPQEAVQDAGGPERAVGDETFSSEPFACPACGQMLAATCRVCVACRQPIDPAKIVRAPVPSQPLPEHVPPPLPTVRFPWGAFIVAFALSMVTAEGLLAAVGPLKTQLVLGGVQILSSFWVFYDAQRRGIPKPLRWGLGTLLLWLVILPWYLIRRRVPQAACPFVERPTGPITRAILFALMVFILLSVVMAVFNGSIPK